MSLPKQIAYTSVYERGVFSLARLRVGIQGLKAEKLGDG